MTTSASLACSELLVTAGSMLADPTREFAPRDGVGVLAVVRLAA